MKSLQTDNNWPATNYGTTKPPPDKLWGNQTAFDESLPRDESRGYQTAFDESN